MSHVQDTIGRHVVEHDDHEDVHDEIHVSCHMPGSTIFISQEDEVGAAGWPAGKRFEAIVALSPQQARRLIELLQEALQ